VNSGLHGKVYGVHEIIPLQAFKEIAERLPQTEEELRRFTTSFPFPITYQPTYLSVTKFLS
jgi:hypothetical protein